MKQIQQPKTNVPGGQWNMLCMFAVVALVATLMSPDAMASATGGTALPWDGPLAKLAASVTGPVAFVVSLLGLVGTLCGLIWGGDMNGVLRGILVLVLIISVLVGAANFLSVMFGVGAQVATLATAAVGIA
jgi:type IV secretion system protein VirB2